MAQLRHETQAFEDRNTLIVVIGPEDAAAFKQYWQKEQLDFIGLPDPSHSVLKLFGQEVKLFKFGRMPAQLIIDKQGVVRFVHYGHDMTDIPPTDEVLALLDQINSDN
jgi:peroxiredoxin